MALGSATACIGTEACSSGGGNCAEKVAKEALLFSEAAEVVFLPLLDELELELEDEDELKSLLKKEFFRSKLFPLATVAEVELEVVVEVRVVASGEAVSVVSSLTCLSALAASFLESLNEPPLEDKLRKDFLETRNDWLRSKLKEELAEESLESLLLLFLAFSIW